MSSSARNPAAQDILTYLSAHSEAEDTIEGIIDWWLVEKTIKHRKKEVQAALDELVAQTLITTRKSEDSRIRYRINNRKMNEIRELLK
jgi:hypothetical protein